MCVYLGVCVCVLMAFLCHQVHWDSRSVCQSVTRSLNSCSDHTRRHLGHVKEDRSCIPTVLSDSIYYNLSCVEKLDLTQHLLMGASVQCITTNLLLTAELCFALHVLLTPNSGRITALHPLRVTVLPEVSAMVEVF